VFLIMCFLLGGIANAAPVPLGLIGFGVCAAGVVCWVAAGSRRY
jgi:hypothetical protein